MYGLSDVDAWIVSRAKAYESDGVHLALLSKIDFYINFR